MGKLSFENGRFYFDAHTRRENLLARKIGLKLNHDVLRWTTVNFDKARALRQWADEGAERKLKYHFITNLSPPECIQYPDDQAPRTWQIENAWHALTRTPCYIADEAGLGKTISAILAINSDFGKTLIICPPYLRFNWEDELKRWLTDQSRFIKLPGKFSHPGISVAEGGLADFGADVCILPDSMLTNDVIRDVVKSFKFKWVIVDEFHRFKTETAKRTEALISSIAPQAERLVFLSGTPFPNGRPVEIYPPLSRLAPEAIGHRDALEFGKAFCAAKRVTRYEGGKAIANWDFSGASNLKQLKRELRAKLMIRHLKKDHLHELGPKQRQFIFLDTPEDIQKLEREQFKDLTLEQILGGKEVTAGALATHRKALGEAKVLACAHIIRERLESSKEKIVVSAFHIDVVETLVRMLGDFHPLKIRGGMTAKEKHEAVRLFQTDKKHRVIVGNTMSMGLGNTLTRAPIIVSVEPEWSPGANSQLEDRVHRISQDKHVYCIYLVMRGSLDERMLRRSLSKESNIDKVMT